MSIIGTAISRSSTRLALCACVVNGEFYGYEKIRQRLLREGRRFSTESDSKIALHLYDTMGAGATSFSQTGGTVQATPTSATKRS